MDFLERAMGLEPTTAAMARRYSSQLSYARVREPLYIFLIKSKEKYAYFSFCLCLIFPYTIPICLVANPLHITHHCSHTSWPISSQEVSSSLSQYWCSSLRASHPSSGSICLVLEWHFLVNTTSGYSHRYWWSSVRWYSWSGRAGQSHDSSGSYCSGSRLHRSSAGMHVLPSDISISMHSWIASWAHRVLWSLWSSSGS